MERTLLVLLAFLLATCTLFHHTTSTCAPGTGSSAPIIGIMSMPFESDQCVTYLTDRVATPENESDGLGSCIWSFYVKWLEQGGARVAVIKYDDSKENLDTIFKSLNGMLFTGGQLEFQWNSTYMETSNYLYGLAVQANSKGDYFPVWGTCMGFQLLTVMTAHNLDVLKCGVFDSYGVSWPLDMTKLAPTSRIYGNDWMPDQIYDILSTQNVTLNLHHCGIYPDTFQSNQALNSFFDVLSTNTDPAGNEFVSTIEAKDQPIYATQWHPERPQYEWTSDEGINHGYNSTVAMQYMSNFFVKETTKNNHCFEDAELEQRSLIYSHTPVNMGDGKQIYYISPAKNSSTY